MRCVAAIYTILVLGLLTCTTQARADATAPDGKPTANGQASPATRPATSPGMRIILTSDTNGFIERCGCPGPEKGGLLRRATLLKDLVDQDTLLVDAGNVNTPDQTYILLGYWYMLDMLDYMGYHAVNLGSAEVQIPVNRLYETIEQTTCPIVSCNVLDATTGKHIATPFARTRIKGQSVAIIGLVEPEPAIRIGAGLTITPPNDALANTLKSIGDSCDIILVAADVPRNTARTLATIFNDRITALLVTNQSKHSKRIDTVEHTSILLGGHGDTDLFEFTIDSLAQGRFTTIDNIRHPVGPMVEYDDHVARLAEQYRNQLGQDPSHYRSNDSDVQRWWQLMQNDTMPDNWYIGATRCRECHSEEYRQWQQTDHAGAYNTLVDAAGTHKKSQCLTCHVVGIDTPTGFSLEAYSGNLLGVQCENCHGPGAIHFQHHKKMSESDNHQMPRFATLQDIQKMCITCHDKANSPNFDFDTYWPPIAHGRLTEAAATQHVQQPSVTTEPAHNNMKPTQ